jgi:hypothetical protein
MFFCLPALKLNDGRIKINVMDQRVEDAQHNIDFVHVTTTDEDGEEQVTHFGIQGRSDHLAAFVSNKEDSPASKTEAKADASPSTDSEETTSDVFTHPMSA